MTQCDLKTETDTLAKHGGVLHDQIVAINVRHDRYRRAARARHAAEMESLKEVEQAEIDAAKRLYHANIALDRLRNQIIGVVDEQLEDWSQSSECMVPVGEQ